MRNKLILVILLTISSTGCVYQSANNTDLRKAVSFCGGVGNIASLTINMFGQEVVKCMDGRMKDTDSYKKTI